MRTLAYFCVWLYCSTLILPNFSYAASPSKRLAIVDAEVQFASDQEKQDLLFSLRSMMSRNSSLAIISPAEIERSLVLKNNLSQEVEKVLQEHEKKRAEIQALLEEAERLYLASEFEQAIPLLESGLSSLDGACLSLSIELPLNLLRTLAASYFFQGNESQAKIYLASILDLDPDALLDAQKYPPNLIDLFNSVKNDPRFQWSKLEFIGSATGLSANFLGKTVSIQSKENKIEISLPLGHPLWGSRALVVTKEGFAPLVFAIDEAPSRLELASLKDKRLSTKGLFQPIGSQTAPVELQKILNLLKPDLILLAGGEHEDNGTWMLEAQWLELPTLKTSPVIKFEDKSRDVVAERLVSELMNYLDTKGNVLLNPEARIDEKEESQSKEGPFYKKQWFWLLLGGLALSAGAGLGAYYLFNDQSDSLRVKIGPAE